MYSSISTQLRDYISQLPEDKQKRFNDGLQKDLVRSLTDGKVYRLVIKLADEQQLLEDQLDAKRQNLLSELQSKPHSELNSKMLENDTNILQQLDKLVMQQQEALLALKVPTFRKTKNNRDIEIQILIVEFIRGLHGFT